MLVSSSLILFSVLGDEIRQRECAYVVHSCDCCLPDACVHSFKVPIHIYNFLAGIEYCAVKNFLSYWTVDYYGQSVKLCIIIHDLTLLSQKDQRLC